MSKQCKLILVLYGKRYKEIRFQNANSPHFLWFGQVFFFPFFLLKHCHFTCVCEEAWNNTYSCVRSLSQSEDMMYCEFADGEVSLIL